MPSVSLGVRSIKAKTRQLVSAVLCLSFGAFGLVALPIVRADTAICPSTLYWINGTGSWGDSSHWSASSGGPPDANLCTPDNVASNVTFDSSSGTGTATVDYNAVLGNVTFTPTTNMKVVFTNGTWTFGIAGLPPESSVDLSVIANAFYVVLFLVFCALLVIGIWKFHQWRS